ncbi:TPA: type IV conjugative transfer system lipoprotein TraV [Klebsiella pneumoniae]|jgi:conjugal transfer pilus assembly protein TraV|uniref:Type IV conjugative transfer system lipoprotein TraV n=17 Tax=Enterobacterales TaxID=91347 RepID=A0A8T3UNV7_ECOLX|nr:MULTISPECIES: type IV conjugative transfer system lipoprotein TraV [Enterobacterales]EBN9829857.1 type IV conjugative transfer system protein TraV [Salmonella enterica subsp. enterica serovar Senftenberg]EBP4126929.1 type IV conjugative transfer system lipoprotein TraV [Salmonella enterica subsp. enterica]EBQ6262289.1 type IV conjugative transfer system lipoprotein TraV [Salmonella enterica subsp. enterica serovar Virchow]EBY8735560.1 type IV conjugative transfer system protein TraV [Salmone
MMTKKIVSALFLVSAGFAMSGCSLLGQNDEYGCKGMPNSVTCMNVRDVYALTDGDDYQEQIDTASENQLSGKPVEVKRLRTTAGNGGRNTADGGRYVPVPATAADPQPIRTQSIVMRVLVDPYETADGDLNVPGYVYTEIEPRRWEVGARNSATSTAVIRPMSAPVAAAPAQSQGETSQPPQKGSYIK